MPANRRGPETADRPGGDSQDGWQGWPGRSRALGTAGYRSRRRACNGAQRRVGRNTH
jgi:hypothetical protein